MEQHMKDDTGKNGLKYRKKSGALERQQLNTEQNARGNKGKTIGETNK